MATLEEYLRKRIDALPIAASSFMDMGVVRRNNHGDLLLWIGTVERRSGERTAEEGLFLVRGDRVTAIDTVEPGCLEDAHRRILDGE